MQRKIISIARAYEPLMNKTFILLAAILTTAVFLYGVFLLEAVAHAASRNQAEREIRDIHSRLSSIETRYLSLTQNLTPKKATELGYVAPSTVTTVFMRDSAHPLVLR